MKKWKFNLTLLFLSLLTVIIVLSFGSFLSIPYLSQATAAVLNVVKDLTVQGKFSIKDSGGVEKVFINADGTNNINADKVDNLDAADITAQGGGGKTVTEYECKLLNDSNWTYNTTTDVCESVSGANCPTGFELVASATKANTCSHINCKSNSCTTGSHSLRSLYNGGGTIETCTYQSYDDYYGDCRVKSTCSATISQVGCRPKIAKTAIYYETRCNASGSSCSPPACLSGDTDLGVEWSFSYSGSNWYSFVRSCLRQ